MLALADDGRLMLRACAGHRTEVGQPIRDHGAAVGRCVLVHRPIAARLKPETGVSLSGSGWPLSFRETVATNGSLFAEPARLCPRYAHLPSRHHRPGPGRRERNVSLV